MYRTRSLLRQMLILSETNVRKALQMKDCLQANRHALISVAQGTSIIPTRLGIPFGDNDNENATTASAQDWTLFKPAATTQHPLLMGCKIISIRSQNPAANLPLVPASIFHMDAATGIVTAVLEGTFLTAARTAAGSALATAVAMHGRTLQHLVVFGAGLQAELHIQAIATALPQTSLPKVTIVNRTIERAELLQEKLQSQKEFSSIVNDVDIVRLDDTRSVSQALSTATCVVTATNTTTPLFDGTLLPAGCHINGIGSYTPEMAEVSAETVNRCRVWIDTREAMQVGDLLHLSSHHPVELLGDIMMLNDPSIALQRNANTDELDCTFYKAVGTAIQDIVTANVVVEQARASGIGVEVDMS